jgi:hypothetical protein
VIYKAAAASWRYGTCHEQIIEISAHVGAVATDLPLLVAVSLVISAASVLLHYVALLVEVASNLHDSRYKMHNIRAEIWGFQWGFKPLINISHTTQNGTLPPWLSHLSQGV